MQRLALSIGMLCASFLVSTQASAHATPVLYEPQASQVLEKAPSTITIHFSERIDPAASSIKVFAPGGEQEKEAATVKGYDLMLPFTAASSGTYAVSWQVVSADDGHFTKGGYVFSVGTITSSGSGAPQFEVIHRSAWPEAISIALELLGIAILTGCLSLVAFLWRALGMKADSLFEKWMRHLAGAAAVFIVTGVAAYILLESRALAIDQASSFSQALSQFVATVTGRYALYRAGVGILLSILLFRAIPSMLRAKRMIAMEGLLWILLMVDILLRARISHAAASGFLPDISILMNAVHLLFKDLWIGGLVIFCIGFLPFLRRHNDARVTMTALVRFAHITMVSLAVGGVTGVYIVWLHLKAPLNLFSTHWGGYCVALTSYALILLTLRLYQQRIAYPSLLKVMQKQASTTEQEEAGMIGMLLVSELLTGLAVLLFSSVMIITTPPLGKNIKYEQTLYTSNAVMTFGEYHDDARFFLVTINRKDTNQRNGSGSRLLLSATDTAQGIGPITIPTVQIFPGGFLFPKDALIEPGTWTIDSIEQEPPHFDVTGRFTILYPAAIDAVHLQNRSHTFGWFEGILLMVAGSLVLLAWILSRQQTQLLLKQKDTIDLHSPSLQSGALPFIVILDISILVIVGVTLGNHNHGSSAFIASCKKAGGSWHENVPMREGRVTADGAALGCLITTEKGAFHFTDAREFEWFLK